MALNTITYTNKVALNVDPSVAEINKVTDANMNEIKTVVNDNATLMGDLTSLTTTVKTSTVGAINELDGDVGNLSNLDTTSQTNLVSAINEVNGARIWSSTEQTIGTWSNQTLYRKVINVGALPNSTTKSVAHNISNLGTVVHIYGYAYRSNTPTWLPLPFVTTGNNCVTLLVSGSNLDVSTYVDRSAFQTSYVVLEYTKTS